MVEQTIHEGLQTYLDSIAMLGEGQDTPQARFWRWQAGVSIPVVVESIVDHPELAEIVKRFRSIHKPQLKGCYETAYKFATMFPEIEYVEGMAFGMIPIDHAWNCWQGIHFDLTSEIALRGAGHDGFDPHYLQVARVTGREAGRFLVERECYDSIKGWIFQNSVENCHFRSIL